MTDSSEPNFSTDDILHALENILVIELKIVGILYATEYIPVTAVPQKKDTIYLSEQLLNHHDI